MRDIEFRAWNDTTKTMVLPERAVDCDVPDNAVSMTGQFLEYSDNCACGCEFREYLSENMHCILMQYTGLKDKNGVKIFEGDIVVFECSWADQSPTKGKVMWDGSEAKFQVLYRHDEEQLWAMDAGIDTYEVIGNIYENPELLEKQDV